jgi:hypothetical protein
MQRWLCQNGCTWPSGRRNYHCQWARTGRRGAAMLKGGTETAVKQARRNRDGDGGQIPAATGYAPQVGRDNWSDHQCRNAARAPWRIAFRGRYAIGNRRIDRHQTSIGMAGLTQPPRLLEFSNRFNLCYIHSSKTRSQKFPLTAVGDDNDPRNT